MSRALALQGGVTLLAGAGAALLLAPGGLLQRWSGASFSYLLPPVLVLVAALLAAAALREPPTLWRRVTARLLVVGAAAGLAWVVLARSGGILTALAGGQGLPGVLSDALRTLGGWLGDAMAGDLPESLALLLGLWGALRTHRLVRRETEGTGAPWPDALRAFLVAALVQAGLAALVTLLLRPGGVLVQALRLDLSPLLWPLVVLLGARLVAWGLVALRPGRTMALAAALLGTAAGFYVAAAALLALPELGQALAASRLAFPGVGAVNAYLARSWTTSQALALAFLATSRGWFLAVGPLEGERWAGHLARGLRLLVLLGAGVAAQQVLAGLAPYWPAARDLGTVAFAALAAVALGLLAPYLGRLDHPLPRGVAQWAEASQLRNLALGAAVATYFVFVRPAVFAAFQYAPVLEWALVVVAAWRLLASVREEVDRSFTAQEQTLAYHQWRRHRQVARLQRDPSLEELRRAVDGFVTYGVKDDLLVALVQALEARGLPPRQVADAVHALIAHQDRPTPWLAFAWERRRRAAQDQRARLLVLRRCLYALELTPEALEAVGEEVQVA